MDQTFSTILEHLRILRRRENTIFREKYCFIEQFRMGKKSIFNHFSTHGFLESLLIIAADIIFLIFRELIKILV